MQYFSTRFMRTYDDIPADVKPPAGAAKLHYANAFSSEFTLLLRERRYVSLEDMMDDATEVEVNLSESHRSKQRHETKRVKDDEPQASTSSSNLDMKHDTMMKAIERLMVKLSSDDKNQTKNPHEP